MQLHEMSFQQRLMLTVAVCIAIVLVWPFVFPAPEPTPEELAATTDGVGTDGAAVEDTDGAKTDGASETADAGDTDGAAEAGDGGETAGDGPGAGPTGEATDDAAFPEQEHVLSNGVIELTVTNRYGGLITDARPLDDQFRSEDGAPLDFMLLGGQRTLLPGFDEDATDFGLSKVGVAEVLEKTDRVFARRRANKDVELVERLELRDGYEALLTVEVRNTSGATQAHRFTVEGLQGELETNNRYDLHRGLCMFREDNNATRWLMKHADGDLNEGDVRWGGVDTNYFAQVFVPRDYDAVGCVFDKTEGEKHLRGSIVASRAELGAGESKTYETALFIGAKRQELLEGFTLVDDADLGGAIYWGYFGVVSRYLGQIMLQLLRWFHSITGIWGVAIMLLTLLIKGLLFPLTIKQMKSMQKMREVAPEMEEIRKKYADDKAKQQQEIQALWQRTGANPASGCLPMVFQLPVFIALYASLQAAVELYHEPFLWMADLTQPDPYYILPLGMGAMMWLNTKLQPQAADNDQQKIMQTTMPVIFTAMMLFLPAGLTVYIFVNTTISVITTLIYLRPQQKKDASTATAS